MVPTTPSRPKSGGLWTVLCVGLGILATLVIALNIAGILASGGGCVMLASIPSILVAGGCAVFALLVAAFRKSRDGVRINALALILVPLSFALLAVVPIGRSNGNESGTIGDLKVFISGQQTYASTNGGYYEARLECLSEPTLCRADFPEDAPSFLGTDLTSLEVRRGYVRMFVPGEWVEAGAVMADDEDLPYGVSRSSILSWGLIAVPASDATGSRGFCIDSSGSLCTTPQGQYPVVSNGRCTRCEILE